MEIYVLNQFDKANIIANKCQNYLKNYNGTKYKNLNDISVEKYFIQFEKVFHSGLNDNESIENLLDSWLDLMIIKLNSSILLCEHYIIQENIQN